MGVKGYFDFLDKNIGAMYIPELGGRLVLNNAKELKCNADAISLAITASLNVQGKEETIHAEQMQDDMGITMHMVIPAKIRSDYEHTDFWHEQVL